ncbi:type II toxin-antitoxin system RelE/ParE family toxin [Phenylobacterium montanum]|uniref:Type II toxin-antitoxin system RelE/ParE family toxin n=1 Tax=Phenylobacterium montanum TaxID=2823693 RepID=A0A975IVS1_9CAUL|nr:type II toxin-antitoxin system RelE/ParE family toxin [Caulobacter sp. S6]QUD87631.1 type II toxin-antitoxin system RelE/ParE family toxin [Caulobacter sp. S6]
MSAVDHYAATAGPRVAAGFVDALEAALRHIGQHPRSGSPRFGQELDLPGLRCWGLKRYPYLAFYIEREDHIDLWRVLHSKQDIPAWLQGLAD